MEPAARLQKRTLYVNGSTAHEAPVIRIYYRRYAGGGIGAREREGVIITNRGGRRYITKPRGGPVKEKKKKIKRKQVRDELGEERENNRVRSCAHRLLATSSRTHIHHTSHYTYPLKPLSSPRTHTNAVTIISIIN